MRKTKDVLRDAAKIDSLLERGLKRKRLEPLPLIDDATFDDTSLRSHCRDRLPQFKVPREIRRLEELPRNPTGKIMRRALGPDTTGVD